MIHYNIPPLEQFEASMRLADAMLFAALRSRFGDKIEPWNNLHSYKGEGLLWEPDSYFECQTQRASQIEMFRSSSLLDVLDGKVLTSSRPEGRGFPIKRLWHRAVVA